jgi:CO/xanthine dehydrogenase FAD-binding subunit
MKPPFFDYHAPATLDEALALLRDCGPDAKPLAGGQSLVPMMNFRLIHPHHLIDLNRIEALSYIRNENGSLCLGAMTRHRQVEHSTLVKTGWPLLSEVMRHVAHSQIRNRGTIGGSLVHADPAAELPAVVTALDATLVLRNASRIRLLSTADFFVGVLTTAIEPDELLVEIRIPALIPNTGCAFDELSRRRGDFAIVGVAVVIRIDPLGTIDFARLAFTGASERFVRSRRAEGELVGHIATKETVARAAHVAASDLTPESDIHATSDYRRAVGEVLARRVITKAVMRSKASYGPTLN